MPKQDFDIIDYMAPIVVALIFAVIVLFISFAIINFYCITKKDDLTCFEKLGGRVNLRLGPHTMAVIRRGGYASTYAREEFEAERQLIQKASVAGIMPPKA
ncbi:neuropeptide-like peptide 36 [Ditylenchus destructor]|uniref:Neuropeptide-like peptide 36 n=1 Tax=Ditylenchus destructor TaxID=166010 RepID=A0AAD4MY92_9BILA|nr:neuropeptide-like peptide 36 [Ditylenchus destructor]